MTRPPPLGEKNTPERHAKGEGVKKFVPTNGPSSAIDPLESDDSSKLWRIFFFFSKILGEGFQGRKTTWGWVVYPIIFRVFIHPRCFFFVFALFWPQTCQKRSCWKEIWDLSMSKSCVKLRFKKFSLEKGVVFCFETSDSNTVQTKFRINTEKIFGLTLSQKMAGAALAPWDICWNGQTSVRVIFNSDLRIESMKSKLENNLKALKNTSSQRKKRVDGFETLNQHTINQQNPQNHNPVGTRVFLFSCWGGGKGWIFCFCLNEAFEKLRDLFWW